MGQYKVPQDVEAEDKIIGSLTLKQFIYATIGVVYAFTSFSLLKSLPVVFIAVGVPPTLLFLMLGLYKRQDQPFEALFLALVNFLVKPRKVIWEKEPIEQVFQLKEPPPPPKTQERNPDEVRGQLEKLAMIVDTRGWSAKQPELQEPAERITAIDPSDRLATFDIPQAPQAVGAGEPEAIKLSDDILDFKNNPSAQNLDSLIQDTTKRTREEAVEKMHQQAALPPAPTPKPPASSNPLPAAAYAQPAKQPSTPQARPHLPSAQLQPSTTEMTSNPLAGILKVAMENEDLTVSQIAAQADRQASLSPGQTVTLRTESPKQPPAKETTRSHHQTRHAKHAPRRKH